MKRYTSKIHYIHAEQWDGTADSELVLNLNRAGWITHIQLPGDGEKTNRFNEEVNQWQPCPARARLVIVGPYRKQLFSLEDGQYLTWHENDSSFGTQDSAPSEEQWEGPSDEPTGVPTPEELRSKLDPDEISW